MWLVDLDDNTPTTSLLPTCNAIILSETTKKDLAQFHHASLGSPVTSTLLASIDAGFLASFPGLTKKLIKKHLPKSKQTSKGHLDQERKNLCSINIVPTRLPPPPVTTESSVPTSPPVLTNKFFCAITPATGRIYFD